MSDSVPLEECVQRASLYAWYAGYQLEEKFLLPSHFQNMLYVNFIVVILKSNMYTLRVKKHFCIFKFYILCLIGVVKIVPYFFIFLALGVNCDCNRVVVGLMLNEFKNTGCVIYKYIGTYLFFFFFSIAIYFHSQCKGSVLTFIISYKYPQYIFYALISSIPIRKGFLTDQSKN